MAKNLKNKKEKILSFIVDHINSFFLDQDATKDCSSIAETKIEKQLASQKFGVRQSITENVHYFIPFVVMVVHLLDSVQILARENFKYNPNGMESLFTHRIFQKEFWLTGTVIVHIVVIMNMTVFALYTFRPKLEPRFTIFALKDTTSVPGQEQTGIIQNGKGFFALKILSLGFLQISFKLQHGKSRTRIDISLFEIGFEQQFGLFKFQFISPRFLTG